VLAQSADLLRACEQLAKAEAAGDRQAAFQHGDAALALAAAADDRQSLDDLLRNLGELAARAGEDTRAAQYFERALALEQRTLGAEHPDLVPVLTALADLRLKESRYVDAEALELRVLDIERKVYGEHHANVVVTLSKLEEIYRASGDAAGSARVQTQIQAATARRAFPSPQDLTGQARKNQAFATVRVFYGTNRAPSGSLKPALYYGKERGELEFGYLDVTIPKLHREAELETQPRWAEYVFDAGEARSRYVLLDKVVPLPRAQFLSQLRAQLSSGSKDAFIFVHGFNNTFEDAARRAAQLIYDLDFDGTPLLYSWPSRGSATAYTADEAAVGISGRRLAEFLEVVIAQSGAERVHLLAHSMGSRALIEAVQTYLARHPQSGRTPVFGQIIFTAPDVDRDYFVDAVQPLALAADRITLYASDNDYALRSSQFFHDAPRAGIAGARIIRLGGLDTIDMSSVPADMLGHNYFAANSGAIFDLFRLLWRGDPPPQRCGMSDRSGGTASIVWVFNAQACNGLDLLEAGVLLKRFGDLARQRVLADIATLTDPTEKQQLGLVLRRLDGLRAALAMPVGAVNK
jgi:esterase/lipase superfamily enzyme